MIKLSPEWRARIAVLKIIGISMVILAAAILVIMALVAWWTALTVAGDTLGGIWMWIAVGIKSFAIGIVLLFLCGVLGAIIVGTYEHYLDKFKREAP